MQRARREITRRVSKKQSAIYCTQNLSQAARFMFHETREEIEFTQRHSSTKNLHHHWTPAMQQEHIPMSPALVPMLEVGKK